MLLTANVPIAQQLLELGAYVSQLEDVLADQRSQRRKFEEANAAAEAKVQRLQQSVSALARENARLRQVNETQAAAAQSFREEVDQQLVLRVVNRGPTRSPRWMAQEMGPRQRERFGACDTWGARRAFRLPAPPKKECHRRKS